MGGGLLKRDLLLGDEAGTSRSFLTEAVDTIIGSEPTSPGLNWAEGSCNQDLLPSPTFRNSRPLPGAGESRRDDPSGATNVPRNGEEPVFPPAGSGDPSEGPLRDPVSREECSLCSGKQRLTRLPLTWTSQTRSSSSWTPSTPPSAALAPLGFINGREIRVPRGGPFREASAPRSGPPPALSFPQSR